MRFVVVCQSHFQNRSDVESLCIGLHFPSYACPMCGHVSGEPNGVVLTLDKFKSLVELGRLL